MKTEVGCNKKQQSVAAGVIGRGNVQPGGAGGPQIWRCSNRGNFELGISPRVTGIKVLFFRATYSAWLVNGRYSMFFECIDDCKPWGRKLW